MTVLTLESSVHLQLKHPNLIPKSKVYQLPRSPDTPFPILSHKMSTIVVAHPFYISSHLFVWLRPKYHTFAVIHNEPILKMRLHCPKQYLSFQYTSLRQQIIHVVSMTNSSNILLNNRPLIQCFCHIVCCRSNKLDTSSMCTVVWPCTYECW